LIAASINLPRSSSGPYILASTSLRSVKCRTSSLGKAVIQSAKKVIAGNISLLSLVESLRPNGPPGPDIEDRGGLFRVCRRGCLRLEERSAGTCFEVFILRV
jgi:hypothetical protein